jgi:hypothetical protein
LAYISPDGSTYDQTLDEITLGQIENDISRLSNDGEIILMGDLNARTGTENDFIENDSDDHIGMENFYTADVEPPKRNNQDKGTNARGPQLLDMCVSTGLRILNGRIVGDSLGYFTCHKYDGSSTVDYGIVSEGLFHHVQFFHVDKCLSELSDHCKISFALDNFQSTHSNNMHKKIELQGMEGTFKWDNTSIFLYQQALSCPDIKAKVIFKFLGR